MAIRFRRSIKISSGLRINFGKKGASLSIGKRGASITVGPRGTYSNIGIPGTGFSYRIKLGGGSQNRRIARQQQRIERQNQRLEEEKRHQEALANFKLALDNESGALQIRDAFEQPLSRSDLKFLWEEKGDALLGWLEQQVEEINGDVDLLLKIHEDTPSPDSEPQYEIVPFSEAPPSQPNQLVEKPKPELAILPPLGFFARMFKIKIAVHLGKQQKLFEEHRKQIRAWEDQNKKEIEIYQNNITRFKKATEQWENRKRQHEANEKTRREEFSKLLRTIPDVMNHTLEDALTTLSWPRETIISYQIADCGRQVWLDVDLPEIEDLPQKIASISASGKKLSIKDKTQKQLQLEYATHIFGIAFRLVGTVFATLPAAEISIISGYSQRLDKSTGKTSDEYLFSIKVDKVRYSKIAFDSLDKVSPIDAMEAFETNCKMTATGIFKVVEPFAPNSKEACWKQLRAPNFDLPQQRAKEIVEAQVAEVEEGERDELYQRAVELVQLNGQASTSFIQRRLRVGYNRAARMIEMMQEDGIVGAADGSKPRQVLSHKNMDSTIRSLDD